MSVRSFRPTIIIPTKDRAQILTQLLDSIVQLEAIDRIRPEVIVADNDSRDNTYEHVNATAKCFPTTMRALKVPRLGKSAAINDAVHAATGNVLAFLDDDVVVDKTWLTSVEEFFQRGKYDVGQGIIRLQSPARDDPEVQKLVQRYRTIPKLEHDPNLTEVRSLNGSNFFVAREVFDRVGGFDERLGPGASGTSEDMEFALRLGRSGIGIGYVSKAVVYHQVDRRRLTDEYFKETHWRQGRSRFLIRNRGGAEILFNLVRAYALYLYYTLLGKERDRYRSKGRIYHYLGMIDAKHNYNADHLEER
jgi:glycosyltransferase involved in cell wall biosynthesis